MIEKDDKKSEDRQAKIFGERYRGANLASYQTAPDIQEKILRFTKKNKNMLVFCGNPGIGKTYLCAALVPWAMKFRSFRYWKEIELFRKLRASIDDSRGDYLETLEHLIDDPLIMLDDIGSTGLTEWRKEIIFSAIEHRYKTMEPTIITSNFTRQEFESQFPPRLADRLFAKENIIIEIHDAQSYRQI